MPGQGDPAYVAAGSSSGVSRNSPSQRAMMTVARQLPRTLVAVSRHVHQLIDPEDDEHRLDRQAERRSVPSRMTSDARGTPATPLLVSISVSSIVSCCPIVISMPAAWATKIEASDR